MFDSLKVGHAIHLTERKKDQFGLALLTPAVSKLVGFGEFAVNMSFTLSFDQESTCKGGRFVVDYGAQRSCFYSKTQPRTPHVLPRPAPSINYEPLPKSDKVLPPPDFKSKPLPWPCPPGSCPCEDDVYVEEGLFTSLAVEEINSELTQDMTVPDCDGISLALIRDPIGPGIFIAKDKSLFFAGTDELTQDEVTVKLEYTRSRDSEHMKFYVNEVEITGNIPFTTATLSQEARIFPKVTFVSSTAECPVSHRISSLWFEMEKVISCAAAQEMLEENEKVDTRLFEFAMLQLSSKENKSNPSLAQAAPMKLIASVAVTAFVALIGLLVKWQRTQNLAPYTTL